MKRVVLLVALLSWASVVDASGPLATGLALFISCNETSNGSVQVDRADSSGNGRTFTDVNTVPSATATAGHPYTNQCFGTTTELLTRADDAGLHIGAGDGWTAALWIERKGAANVNAILFGRYNSAGGSTEAFAFATTTGTDVVALSVSSAVQTLTSALGITLDKRTLLVASKPTGSSNLTLYLRAFDGSWSSTGSGTIGQTNAGTVATTINGNSGGTATNANVRIGPVMYWPSRLLDSGDRDALFNAGSGLTLAQMGGACSSPGIGATSVGVTSVGRTSVGPTATSGCP